MTAPPLIVVMLFVQITLLGALFWKMPDWSPPEILFAITVTARNSSWSTRASDPATLPHAGVVDHRRRTSGLGAPAVGRAKLGRLDRLLVASRRIVHGVPTRPARRAPTGDRADRRAPGHRLDDPRTATLGSGRSSRAFRDFGRSGSRADLELAGNPRAIRNPLERRVGAGTVGASGR